MSACIALVVWSATASAAPGDGKPLYQRGIQLYREAAYADSAVMLEHARARGGLAPQERVECSFYLGANYVALSSLGAARRELRALLQEEPEYELPQYTSPKVAALFREVKEELERAPRLRPLPPERHGDELTLRFEPSRTGGRAYGAVQWRWRGDGEWREVPMAHKGNELQATVVLERTGGLEYWADARAATGALKAGSAEQPLELPVAVGPRVVASSRNDRSHRAGAARLWWVWTGVGALAMAGAGVGLYFALRPTPQPTADAVFDFQVR
ncbi:MAG: hypothetical protein JWN44_974 [Myxococcales bacterium]|nr:hypothetical protein [Myxococcales bacterium]